MLDELTVNELTVFISIGKESMFIDSKVSKMCLLIINCHSSRNLVVFIQFARNYNIRLIYFTLHFTYLLQPLEIRIFQPHLNVYWTIDSKLEIQISIEDTV